MDFNVTLNAPLSRKYAAVGFTGFQANQSSCELRGALNGKPVVLTHDEVMRYAGNPRALKNLAMQRIEDLMD